MYALALTVIITPFRRLYFLTRHYLYSFLLLGERGFCEFSGLYQIRGSHYVVGARMLAWMFRIILLPCFQGFHQLCSAIRPLLLFICHQSILSNCSAKRAFSTYMRFFAFNNPKHCRLVIGFQLLCELDFIEGHLLTPPQATSVIVKLLPKNKPQLNQSYHGKDASKQQKANQITTVKYRCDKCQDTSYPSRHQVTV